MINFNEYFNRQINLWGEDTQKSLQNKKVAIIGSGGLGSSLGFALGASGIGEFTLVDFDTVSVSNIHRQIAFKVSDEGKHKSIVLKELIESRCPFTKATAYVESFDEFSKRDLKFDLVIDATDNLPTRAAINSWCQKNNQIWLYGSVEEFHGQVCLFEKSSYEAVFQITNRKPNGIACPIVMNIASLQANIAIRFLAGLEVQKDILHYLYFDKNGNLGIKKFNLPK
ncbi:HesA/MoeB/ThiF family protein [Aliarcobacter cibarius]|jgi:molybdopterin-synthase adenylyltransferase|uniref:Thiamine biosynthesis protein ThiF n=1 Tax=Aliarcobacter cibarius TaxID=255507 RepID=A0ABY2V1F7_9BACT|nr:ThiF family adenylyltransferase [Aliarcobacter cibarius]TLS95376.1 thiamine biosynthesis protein ThiF [Aliarcobacter cibarius]TLS95866.1 thiamine biosynthesis protein ThiF [Aliarcobacter cibarius]TLT03000.1 thiamine biosynthesis protein ThiF [Aliarcobacter cibarius]